MVLKTLESAPKGKQYCVVLAVSCVNSIDELIKRNILRTQQTAEELKNPDGGTPEYVKNKLDQMTSLSLLPNNF